MSQRMFLDPVAMHEDFKMVKLLGNGGDGIVSRYDHRRIPGRSIAVKTPRSGSDRVHQSLQDEINNLKALNNTELFVEMLGWDDHWLPHGPAIFSEFCEFGDTGLYSLSLRQLYRFVPEETIWKLFADVAKGLDHMHNKLGGSLVHADLKPENIMVCRPRDCLDKLPILPIFKIGDLARTETYTLGNGRVQRYDGTPEYAPPEEERHFLTPATDIWALGASLQSFALGIQPVMQKDKFIQAWGKKHRNRPKREDLVKNEWRYKIPVVYRPLNATPADQIRHWDMMRGYTAPQYSNSLNRWYTMCMETNMHTRVTAEDLVKYLVPVAERQIAILQAKRMVERSESAVQEAKQNRRKPAPRLPTVFQRTGPVANRPSRRPASPAPLGRNSAAHPALPPRAGPAARDPPQRAPAAPAPRPARPPRVGPAARDPTQRAPAPRVHPALRAGPAGPVDAPTAGPAKARPFEKRGQELKREDFGLPPRQPRELLRGQRLEADTSDEHRKLQRLEQKYMKGMKKNPR